MGQQQGKTEIKIHREIITKLRWLPIRGSAFNNTSNSGPSALNLNNPRSNSNDNIGFRSALPLCQEALSRCTGNCNNCPNYTESYFCGFATPYCKLQGKEITHNVY